MKEIKFRVWDKVSEIYLNPENLYLRMSGDLLLVSIQPELKNAGIESVVLEQYTGLKDLNGKEIFEGDIVKMRFAEGAEERNVEIKFKDASFCAETEYWTSYALAEHDLVIVGNVHTNPELLEKNND